jgi:hypothetical protein
MQPWLTRALNARNACTALNMAVAALGKAQGESASPARLEELSLVVWLRQEAYRRALLELQADCQDELDTLPPPRQVVAGHESADWRTGV